ncbi:hypothetical protein ACFL35_10850 [Candidatus Riflebacteria bacterium]
MNDNRREHFKKTIKQFLENDRVILSIIFLILISIALLIWEFQLDYDSVYLYRVQLANDLIVLIFVIELSLRLYVSKTAFSFFREYWVDILAILPMLRIFRLARGFLLLRLLRVFGLGTFIRRHFFNIQHLFSKRHQDYLILFGMVFFSIFAGTIGFLATEQILLKNMSASFWTSIFTLFSGEYVTQFPSTMGNYIT